MKQKVWHKRYLIERKRYLETQKVLQKTVERMPTMTGKITRFKSALNKLKLYADKEKFQEAINGAIQSKIDGDLTWWEPWVTAQEVFKEIEDILE